MGSAIRHVEPRDADALLALQHRLDAESEFMLLEPGERPAESAELRGRLEALGTDGSFVLAAEDERGLCGYVEVSVLPYRRAAATGTVVMGVERRAGGRGVGAALLQAAEHEARARALRRLELTVMTHNHRALRLYLRAGYVVEGLRRRALVVSGRAVDEYYAALLLDASSLGLDPAP